MTTLNRHSIILMTFCGVAGACTTPPEEDPFPEGEINALDEQSIPKDDFATEDQLEQRAPDSSDLAASGQDIPTMLQRSFLIRSRLNDKCLDVLGANTANGARVGMWPCVNTAKNHQWYEKGELIKSRLNGKCLDVLGANTANGARVGMWPCVPGAANHRWYWDGPLLRSKLNGKCLDVLGANTANGARVGMWPCLRTAANHQWYKVNP